MTNKEAKKESRRTYHAHWRRRKVGSQTPGSTKRQDTCQATGLEKYFAKTARSYKHPSYQAWSEGHKVK